LVNHREAYAARSPEPAVTDPQYTVGDTREIISPGLVLFRDLIEANLDRMVRIAGSPSRLRPHCKTHKMREVIELQLARGIAKHKCATIAEAEMLAEAGVRDIFLAYNVVGPNIGRVARFVQKYPQVKFAVTADHPRPLAELGEAMTGAGQTVDVLLDIDTGLHRTGIAAGPAAGKLYRQISTTQGLTAGGFHLYDGHNHQKDVAERRAAVLAVWHPAAALRDELIAAGMSVPRIVAGGTASFPIFATLEDPVIELSPGTITLQDFGYGDAFPDLAFQPAALLLTRVISRPTADRLTLDLGYKAVAAESPLAGRVRFPDLPDARLVLQNEEHLVLESAAAARYAPGDELWAIPKHICPTCALYKHAFVVAGGKLVGTWAVSARDRMLSV
jgi:D-serine deaminase-like pyridoxal phosphate-dependent protein